MADNQNGHSVSLLEWSHQLDRNLLHIPFRALKTTSGSRPSLLYKLTSCEHRQECGILLLDPDTCTAYYEGISLRTLSRRVDLSSAQTSADQSELKRLVEAVHNAVLQPTSTSKPLKRNIGWEQSRFSSSLSISVASRDDEYRFKTSFDLDPLDHAAQASLLSSHFIRPLLSLANVIASTDASPDLSLSSDASDRSLKLIQRQYLQLLGLPVPHDSLFALSSSTVAVPTKASRLDQNIQGHTPSAPADSDVDQDLDSDPVDSIFFGPVGVSNPWLSPGKPGIIRGNTSSPPTEPENIGDTTVVASSKLTPSPATRSADVKLRSGPSAPLSITADDDSDTEEDEIGMLHLGLNKPATAFTTRSPVLDTKSQQQTSRNRPTTPSPAETPSEPTTSQNSPSKSAVQRQDQKRRREEIKRMKEAAAAGNDSRKRSRF